MTELDFQKEINRATKTMQNEVKRYNRTTQQATKNFYKDLFGQIEKKTIRLNTNQTRKLKELTGMKCELCNKKVRKTHYLQHHHIIPIKEGGKNTLGNIIILCLFCHADVHYDVKKSKTTYRKQLRSKVKSRNKRLSRDKKAGEKLKKIYSKKKK